MTVKSKTKFSHWNYFLVLEADLLEVSRFIEFAQDNYDSYSIENARLILLACSEVDKLCHKLCSNFSKRKKNINITFYRETLNKHISHVAYMKVEVPRYGLEIIPFDNWQKKSSPDFWQAYNRIKHDITKHKEAAKLIHAINSIAALFILNLYYYRKKAEAGELGPPSVLFYAEEAITGVGQSKFGITNLFKLK